MSYRIELGTGDQQLSIDGDDIVSPSFDLEHTQLTDWSFSTHYDPDFTTYADTFAELRVYWDDDLLYIGEAVRHRRRDGGPGGGALSLLEGHGRGFSHLKRDAPDTPVTYTEKPYWEAIRDYWVDHTNFTPTITEQQASLMDDGRTVLWASDAAEWDAETSFASDQPIHIPGDRVEPLKTAFTTEGEAYTAATTTSTSATEEDNGDYSDGTSAPLYRGPSASGGPDYAEWEFTLDYLLPASAFGAKARDHADSSGSSAFQWYLLHANGNRYDLDYMTNVGAGLALGWSEIGDDGNTTYSTTGYTGPDLDPGTYRLGVEITDSNGNVDNTGYLVDVVCPFDMRYSYFFDNTVHQTGGYLDGPERYPDKEPFRLDQIETPFNAIEATLDTEGDTGGGQRVGLSLDGGSTWTYETNSPSVTISDADNVGRTIDAEIQLGRRDSPAQAATPRYGYEPQFVGEAEVFYDGEFLPRIDEKTFDGSHLENLQQMHEAANFVFAIDHSREDLLVASFPRGGRTKPADWELGDRDEQTAISVEHDDNRREYANAVTAIGAKKDDGSGDRYRYTAEADAEIQRLIDEGLSEAKARVHVVERDPDAESPSDVETVAQTSLSRRVEEGKTKGSVEIVPTWVQPGYSYEVEALGGQGLVLNSISLDVGGDSAGATLDFVETTGYVRDISTIRGRIKRLEDSS